MGDSPYLLRCNPWAPPLVPAKRALISCEPAVAAAVVMAGAIGGGVVGVQIPKETPPLGRPPVVLVVKVPERLLKAKTPLVQVAGPCKTKLWAPEILRVMLTDPERVPLDGPLRLPAILKGV